MNEATDEDVREAMPEERHDLTKPVSDEEIDELFESMGFEQ